MKQLSSINGLGHINIKSIIFPREGDNLKTNNGKYIYRKKMYEDLKKYIRKIISYNNISGKITIAPRFIR